MSSSLKTKESLSKPDSGITIFRNLVVRDACTPTDQSISPFSGRLTSPHISDMSSFFIRNLYIQLNVLFELLASYSLFFENWHWLEQNLVGQNFSNNTNHVEHVS